MAYEQLWLMLELLVQLIPVVLRIPNANRVSGQRVAQKESQTDHCVAASSAADAAMEALLVLFPGQKTWVPRRSEKVVRQHEVTTGITPSRPERCYKVVRCGEAHGIGRRD
jgi:hypothetical protein